MDHRGRFGPRRIVLGLGAWLCALTLPVAGADAATRLVSATRVDGDAQTVSGTTPTFLVLDQGTGGTVINVLALSDATILVFVEAECAVADAGSLTRGLVLEVFIDGGLAFPGTGSLKAFCSANGSSALDGWVSAALHGGQVAGPGIHPVRVRARLDGAGTGSIDEMSVIIVVDETSPLK
jgi:hypothetical protein